MVHMQSPINSLVTIESLSNNISFFQFHNKEYITWFQGLPQPPRGGEEYIRARTTWF